MLFLLSFINAPDALAQATVVQADLHLDTPTQLFRQDVGMDGAALEGSLARLEAGGTNLTVQVLWPPRNADWSAHTRHLLERLETELERPELVRVDTATQARAAAVEGRIGVTIALEGAHGLSEDWRWQLFGLVKRGLRMVGLTWSMSNDFAGSSGDAGGGLTEQGRALVAMCQELGLMVDVSHASEATTMEVCTDSPVPVIASHSGARAIQDHVRNLGDAEIRCIAESGGVIGLNLHAPFLGGTRDARAAVAHVQHLREIGGDGVLALGSDFDGIIQPPKDVRHAGELGQIWSVMEGEGIPDGVIQGMRGDNFLRAWSAVSRGRPLGR